MRATHFYHVFADGLYNEPMTEHVEALKQSGLLENLDSVKVGLVGAKENRERARKLLPEHEVVAEAVTGWEQVTLEKLHEWSSDNEGAVFYAHTKGAWSKSELARQWRTSMTHDTVTRWRECVAALETHDAAGPYWLKSKEPEHADHEYFFAGNYWWARTQYVRTLPPVKNYNRYQAEGWIGLKQPTVENMRDGQSFWGNFWRPDDTF